MRVTDVLCLSVVTIHDCVPEWPDAEGLDVRPGEWWVKKLLYGVRYKKPAKCVKELHSPEQQHANTHRLFNKLCWLTDKHAVSADRLVNIDESCRLLPVHQIGWDRPGVKHAQPQGNTRRPRRSRLSSAWTVVRWTCSCGSCTRARQTLSCWGSPGHSPRHGWARRPRSCSSRPHWTTC